MQSTTDSNWPRNSFEIIPYCFSRTSFTLTYSFFFVCFTNFSDQARTSIKTQTVMLTLIGFGREAPSLLYQTIPWRITLISTGKISFDGLRTTRIEWSFSNRNGTTVFASYIDGRSTILTPFFLKLASEYFVWKPASSWITRRLRLLFSCA